MLENGIFWVQIEAELYGIWCPEHESPQQITEAESVTGFAGGDIDFYTLACGCKVVDDSDDVAAAI